MPICVLFSTTVQFGMWVIVFVQPWFSIAHKFRVRREATTALRPEQVCQEELLCFSFNLVDQILWPYSFTVT